MTLPALFHRRFARREHCLDVAIATTLRAGGGVPRPLQACLPGWARSGRILHSSTCAFSPLEAAMFKPTPVVIQAFVEQLQGSYQQIYGVLEPAYPGIIGFIGRLALENIA